MMMQCDSASESDTSSVDGSNPSAMSAETMKRRIDSLLQEKRVLRMEVETLKLRVKGLQQENLELRRSSVQIQKKAEEEEEFITNTMLKKIQNLQKEKERLCQTFEQEEEHLSNDLTRRMLKLKQEKVDLEFELEREQENQINKLLKRIERLEQEVCSKQASLDQLRQEKVSLESQLEQEHEALTNRLWKRMEKLENEKRNLQKRLEAGVKTPEGAHASENMDLSLGPEEMATHIQSLKLDLESLRQQLNDSQAAHEKKMMTLEQEERGLQEENLKLKYRLQEEVDKRERLTRNLSESDAGSEIDCSEIPRCVLCHQNIPGATAMH